MDFNRLNAFAKIEFLEAISPNDLRDQIRQLDQEVEIIAMYSAGSKHYAWVNVRRPIVKKKKQTKNKG